MDELVLFKFRASTVKEAEIRAREIASKHGWGAVLTVSHVHGSEFQATTDEPERASPAPKPKKAKAKPEAETKGAKTKTKKGK